MPIKHTRPKVQKFDNGFIIEDTHMGPAQGKVGCPILIGTGFMTGDAQNILALLAMSGCIG